MRGAGQGPRARSGTGIVPAIDSARATHSTATPAATAQVGHERCHGAERARRHAWLDFPANRYWFLAGVNGEAGMWVPGPYSLVKIPALVLEVSGDFRYTIET